MGAQNHGKETYDPLGGFLTASGISQRNKPAFISQQEHNARIPNVYVEQGYVGCYQRCMSHMPHPERTFAARPLQVQTLPSAPCHCYRPEP